MARAHGATLREYLDRVSVRELSLQLAYEEVAGPQGEDRDDYRFAWLAHSIGRMLGGEVEFAAVLGDLRYHLTRRDDEEPEIIDDPDLVEAHSQRVQEKIFAAFGKPPEKKDDDGRATQRDPIA